MPLNIPIYAAMNEIRIGKRTYKLPASRLVRMGLGIALIIGGLLWFLPVVGIWMLPLGLAVLAVDVPVLKPVAERVNDWITGLVDRFRRRK